MAAALFSDDKRKRAKRIRQMLTCLMGYRVVGRKPVATGSTT